MDSSTQEAGKDEYLKPQLNLKTPSRAMPSTREPSNANRGGRKGVERDILLRQSSPRLAKSWASWDLLGCRVAPRRPAFCSTIESLVTCRSGLGMVSWDQAGCMQLTRIQVDLLDLTRFCFG